MHTLQKSGDFLTAALLFTHTQLLYLSHNAREVINTLFIENMSKIKSKTKVSVVKTNKKRKQSDSENATETISTAGKRKAIEPVSTTPITSSSPPAKPRQINTAWAASLVKVLRQPTPQNRKSVVLSKAKRPEQIAAEKEKNFGFEIDGEIVDEQKPDLAKLDEHLLLQKIAKRNKKLHLRVKPSTLDWDRERMLKRIATKGVVQLFNAVRAQQKDLHRKLEDVGQLDHKRDAVLNNINKKKFLDVLMGGSRAKSEMVDNPIKDEIKNESDDDDEYVDGPAKQSQWSVLR